jgi:hypothetical protein
MARKFYREINQAFPSIAFEEEAPEGFEAITDHDERKRLHKKRYKDLERDGVDYFHAFQADLYIDILDGSKQALDVLALQGHLKTISEEIKEGSWLTAQLTLPSISLSGIFDQEMKDLIQSDLNDYVLDNY